MTDLNSYAYNDLLISDLHKDARGFRPRIDFNNGQWTKEKVDTFYDDLLVELQETIKEEEDRSLRALVEYSKRINKLMVDHNISNVEAIRWDMQAEGVEVECEQDADFYLYEQGLGFKDREPFMPLVLTAAGIKKVA